MIMRYQKNKFKLEKYGGGINEKIKLNWTKCNTEDKKLKWGAY